MVLALHEVVIGAILGPDLDQANVPLTRGAYHRQLLMSMEDEIGRKLVIVGDYAVGMYTPPKSPALVLNSFQKSDCFWIGKTSLCIAFNTGLFPEVYVSGVLEAIVTVVEVKHQVVHLALCDTASQGHIEERLRPLSYIKAHAILLCFSFDSPDSLENIKEKWIVEIRHFVDHSVPVYLVGCKSDLRADPYTLTQLSWRGQSIVTTAQVEEMAKTIGAAACFECSSKTGDGVRQIFLNILDAIHDGVPVKQKPPKVACCVVT